MTRYRVGRSLGRTIYRSVDSDNPKDDTLLGMMDTRELAQMVVDALNNESKRIADLENQVVRLINNRAHR